MAIPKQEQKQESEDILGRAVDWHGHLGPFLVLGVRMALIGIGELEAKRGDPKLRVTVMTKPSVPFSCVIDGVQAATRCTIGNRRLRLRNSRKNISARFRILEGKMVTVTLKPAKQEELEKLLSKHAGFQEMEKLARNVISMPESELFRVKERQPSFWTSRGTTLQANDLKVAEERLKRKNLALVIAKRGEVIFETSSHGVGGLLIAIEELDKEMKDSSVADKIFGRAAALLCLHAGVFAVFAVVASEEGIQALKDCGVLCRFENRVPHILDSKRSDICPFEKLIIGMSNPKEAYEKLRSLAAERRLVRG